MSIFGKAADIYGAKSRKKGAKRARKAGEKGAQESGEIIGDATGMARDDLGPYRQGGAAAWDAALSMVGLRAPDGSAFNFNAQEAGRKANDRRVTGEDYLDIFADAKLKKKGKRRLEQFRALNPYDSSYGDQQYIEDFMASVGGKRTAKKLGNFQQKNPYGAAYGGPIHGRVYGGAMEYGGRTSPTQYNVNEQGPENVFGGGAVSRNSNPQTIEPDGDGYVQPNENPGGVEGGYNFQTDPGYAFRFNEGQRGLERGAAAAGGLLSGGFGRKAIRYGQDYASNEYNNVYNRIAAIAGMGANAAGASGGYAMQGGFGQAGARMDEAGYRASGFLGQADAQGQVGQGYGAMAQYLGKGFQTGTFS